MPFSPGDTVQPKPEFIETVTARGAMAKVPSGIVREVVKWGNGQVLYVGDDKRPFYAGCFDKA